MFYIIQKRDTKAFCQRKIGFEKFCKKHDIKPMLTGFCAFCGFGIDEFYTAYNELKEKIEQGKATQKELTFYDEFKTIFE